MAKDLSKKVEEYKGISNDPSVTKSIESIIEILSKYGYYIQTGSMYDRLTRVEDDKGTSIKEMLADIEEELKETVDDIAEYPKGERCESCNRSVYYILNSSEVTGIKCKECIKKEDEEYYKESLAETWDI